MRELIKVHAVCTTPILALMVSPPAGLVTAVFPPGQHAVESFHVTVARLDDIGIKIPCASILPQPPALLTLKPEVRMVRTAEKSSCYVELDVESQIILDYYVRACEKALGVSLQTTDRVYHVTLTNAGGGDVRASVGAVWQHPSWTLPSRVALT